MSKKDEIIESMIETLNALDGYGIVFTDEDLARRFSKRVSQRRKLWIVYMTPKNSKRRRIVETEYYEIWQGRDGDEVVVMAINKKALAEEDCNGAEDFFLPRCTEIKNVGEIEIDGDNHWLADSFEVK
jgi:hypothetical protein